MGHDAELLAVAGGDAGYQYPTANLVSEYLGEGNWDDVGGVNSNDGVITGATPIANRKGVANSAYFCDGGDDVITVAHDSSLNIMGANESFFIFWWMKTVSHVVARSVMTKWISSTDRAFEVQMIADGKFTFQMYDGTNLPNVKTSTNTNDGAFHSYGLVRDVGNSKMLFYVDGLDDSTGASDVAFNVDFNNAAPVRFGSRDNSTQWANVIFDEAVIYNAAPTPAQVLAMHNGSKA